MRPFYAALVLLAAATLAALVAAESSGQGTSAAPEPIAPVVSRTIFTSDQATCPETVVYLFMRNLASDPSAKAELRDQIDKWRAMAHDRRRKVGDEWVWPATYKARRKLFLDRIKVAQDALKGHVGSFGSGASGAKNDAERQRAQNDANAKFKAAANTWLDPLLRNYLQGLAFLNSKPTSRGAETYMHLCIQAEPQVGGFQQAYGLALLADNRPLDAVAAFTDMLRLQCDSRDAVTLLREGMKKVPGVQIKRPQYLKAQELLKAYPNPERAPGGANPGGGWGDNQSQTYLMPGKPWVIRDPVQVPTPPYDRLVFRQAPAVPVSSKVLLVDAQALAGALEIYVQVDALTLVPAKVKAVGAMAGKKLPPLALLTVTDYEFTPVESDKDSTFEPLTHATIYATNLYREMGPNLRQVPTRVKSVDSAGLLTLSAAIAPGEAAAPVVTSDDRLAGFLAARTDVGADQGGPNTLIPLSEIQPLLDQAKRASSGGYGSYGSYGSSVQRTVTTKPAKGKVFVVRVTSSEGPEK